MLFVPHICSILNNLCPNLKTDVMTCIGSAEKKQRDSLDRFLKLQEHKKTLRANELRCTFLAIN